jgi:hypothetical protein
MCTNQTMTTDITSLKTRIELLEDKDNQRTKLRTTAEILTPIVREIQSAMIDHHVPDCYYSKTIIKYMYITLSR